MADDAEAYARAVSRIIDAVSARTMTRDAAVARILAAQAERAVPETADRNARLLEEYAAAGADHHAVSKAARAVAGRDPQARASAERQLRRLLRNYRTCPKTGRGAR